jgi:hypothetical protein
LGDIAMKNSLFLVVSILILSFNTTLKAADTEDIINANNTKFLNQIKLENPEYSQRISELFGYILNQKKTGARVLDRFGIFLNDCKKNNMSLKKTYFSSGKKHFTVFLILQDRSDSHEYILFTQYAYNSAQRTCKLVDIYFSLVFDAKMKSMKALFSDEDNFASPNNSKDSNKDEIINSYRE